MTYSLVQKNVILSVAVLCFASCKNNVNNDKSTQPLVEASKSNLAMGCYEYNKNGDSIKFKITEVDDEIVGQLDFKYAEKDANAGVFIGKINGDKLIGDYTFTSEGVNSTRQIAFLIKENQLVEGYGEQTEDGQKFKDTSTIKYSSPIPLAKTECSN